MAKLVVLDGSALIRLWDPRHPRHNATVAAISDLRDAHTKLLIPTTALIDILVGAEHEGPHRVRYTLKQIRDAFGTPQPIDFKTTTLAARYRANHNIPTPAALILATGHLTHATEIITADKTLDGTDPRVRAID